MDDTALLAALAVDPTGLDPAPDRVRTADARARYGRCCSVCGARGVATTIVNLPAGPRWLDTCRDHMLAAARLRSGETAA